MSAVVIPVRADRADAATEAARALAVLDQMFAYYTPQPLPPAADDQPEYDLVA